MNLEIVIITYNRSSYLQQTLDFLKNSCLKSYKITVLDNGSVDDTRIIANEFLSQFPNISVITHRNNIGLGANIIRAFEVAQANYTWVICDDDNIDLADFNDVLSVIEKEEVELIQVGGHYQEQWNQFAGQIKPVKELYKSGYPYFKLSSFLPTNIIKTSVFQKNYLIAGYANVVNAYPHMPYLLDVYKRNSLLYVSKKQVVVARPEGQSYNLRSWFLWWMRTCELLTEKDDIRLAYFDQWSDIGITNVKEAIANTFTFYNDNSDLSYMKYFMTSYFNKDDLQYLKELRRNMKRYKYKTKAKEFFPFIYKFYKSAKV